MAALDFPNAPSNGQLFTAPNGTTYQWNGTLWVVYGTPGSVASQVATPIYDSTSANPVDGGTVSSGNNPMLITQGQPVFSRTFTAVDPTHPIEVDATLQMGAGGAPVTGYAALFIDGASVAVAQAFAVINTSWSVSPMRVFWQGVLTAGPHTFQIRFGANASNVILNGNNAVAAGGGAIKSTLKISEIGIGAVGPQGPPGPTGGPVAAPTFDSTSVLMSDATWGNANSNVTMAITQGLQVFSRSFTAVDATHPIEVDVTLPMAWGGSGAAVGGGGLFIDGVSAAVAQQAVAFGGGYINSPIRIFWQGVLSAGPHTFAVRFGGNAANFWLNGGGNGLAIGGGAQKSTMTIRELGIGIVGPQGAPGPAAGFLQTVDGRTNLWQPSKVGTYAYNTDALPTQAAGALIYTTNITPLSATSKLRIEALVNVMGGTNAVVTIALFRDGVIVGSGQAIPGNDNWPVQVVIDRLLPSTAMSPTSFTLYIGTNSAVPVHINGTSASRILGGSLYSGMLITERTV